MKNGKEMQVWERKLGVSKKVLKYIEGSRSVNTIRGYRADLKQFMEWGGRIPTRPETIAEFLADMAETKCYSTLIRYRSALRLAHKARGYVNPGAAEIVTSTLRGIRRSKEASVRRAKPLLACQVVQAAGPARTLREKRDRAILLLGFCGAFRRSELVALRVNDLGWDGKRLVVKIRKSKTDQIGISRTLIIPCGQSGSCPIHAVRDWLRAAAIREGLVFRRIDRHGNIGSSCGAEIVSGVVKRAAAKLGLDVRGFSGHSLRAGFVTSAALAGQPEWRIRAYTGHTSLSVLLDYVRVDSSNRVISLT